MKICLLLLSLAMISCGSVPNVTLTALPEGGPSSVVDDSLFANTIEHCIAANGALSYTKLHGDSDLTYYLREIARRQTDAFTSRWQELAFWINAHNAYVLDIIRSNPPVHSISDISGFKYAKVALIGGERYSLNQIEHEILSHRFREPRAFFALYDGSKGSSILRSTPYLESKISDQLDSQVREFLADSTKNLLDRHSNALYLSQIFHEYSDELEKVSGSILEFVRAFAPPPMAAWISSHPGVRLASLSYDYTLHASDIEQPHERVYHRPATTRSSGGVR